MMSLNAFPGMQDASPFSLSMKPTLDVGYSSSGQFGSALVPVQLTITLRQKRRGSKGKLVLINPNDSVRVDKNRGKLLKATVMPVSGQMLANGIWQVDCEDSASRSLTGEGVLLESAAPSADCRSATVLFLKMMKTASKLRLRISYFAPDGTLIAHGFSAPFATHNNGKERLPSVDLALSQTAAAAALATPLAPSAANSYLGHVGVKRERESEMSFDYSWYPQVPLQQLKRSRCESLPAATTTTLTSAMSFGPRINPPTANIPGCFTFVYERVQETPPDSPSHSPFGVSPSPSPAPTVPSMLVTPSSVFAAPSDDGFSMSSAAAPFDFSFLAQTDDAADQAAFDIAASTIAQQTSSIAPAISSSDVPAGSDDIVFPLLLQTVDYLESLLA